MDNRINNGPQPYTKPVALAGGRQKEIYKEYSGISREM